MKLSKEERAHWSKEQKRYYKQHGIPLEPNANVIYDSIDHVTVLCVKFGTKYGPEYVEKLRNMVSRHLTIPYEFVLLTDDHRTISGVRSIVQPPGGYAKAWWHKVHMFDPNLNIKGRILYCDLDVIIHKNINKLVQNKSTLFYGIRDFNRKFYPSWNSLNSSVMTWIHGTQSDIWTQFQKDKVTAQRLHGDQDWIWKIAKDRIKFFPNEWIQSYKWEIRSRDELFDRTGKKGFKSIRENVVSHNECSIAVFHGDPKPEDIKDSFVVDNWQ